MQKKKRLKKSLSMLLAVVMIFTMLPLTTFAADTDIDGHWAEETMLKWSDMGWFNGDGAGTYRPNLGITRAEFMALVNRMESYSGEYDNMGKFTDISPNAWYYSAASTALAAGYITGTSDTTISPEKNITRQEAMTIIARIANVSASDTSILSAASDESSVADWAKAAVATCINEGLVAGSNGKIHPTSNITRAESVVLLDRIYSDIRTYAFEGTYGSASGTTTAASVNVASSGVTLQNMTVKGDLTIGSAVGEGEVYLNNVNVQGTLNVEGGGMDSIYLTNCTINELTITKDRVHVVLENGSTVSFARIEGVDDFIELKGNTTIATLTITGNDTLIKTESGVSITTLNSNADGVAIETVNGTRIGTANINGSTEINGKGSITTANINADGVVIEAAPSTTNVEAGVTADIGGTKITGTGSGDSGNSGGGGGGGGGGSGTTDPDPLYQSHNISTRTVAFGTIPGDLDLPGTVTLTASTSATGTATVTWDYTSYSANTAGSYAITGTLSGATVSWAPATITVTVIVESPLTVTDGTSISDITVKSITGESEAAAKLPTSTVLTLSNGSTLMAGLSWDCVGTYSSNAGAENTFAATISGLPANVIMPTITAKVLVAQSDNPEAASVMLTATPQSVQRPQDGTDAIVILTAVAYDQFGDAFSGATLNYELVGNTDSEISYGITGSGNTITITGDSTAESVTAKVTVSGTSPEISDTVIITITDEVLVATTLDITSSVSSMTLPASGTSTFTFAGSVKDQFGNVMTAETITWSIQSEVTGVDVTANGTVTVDSSATNGSGFVVMATGGGLTETIAVTISKAASVATTITISGDATIYLPGIGAADNTTAYTATILDQYGVSMGGTATWDASGVSNVIIGATGILSIPANATTGTVTIIATFGSISNTFNVNIAKATAVASSITISGEDTVYVPGTGENANTKTYTAVITDQYGETMSGTMIWSVSGVTGVTISNGTLSVPATAGVGMATITASSGTASGTKTVTITKADSVLTTITVTGPSTIAPGSTGTYLAVAYDQYSVAMTGISFTWNIDPAVTGISVSGGVVTVESTVAEDTAFTVKAASGSVSGSANATATSDPFVLDNIRFESSPWSQMQLAWINPAVMDADIAGFEAYVATASAPDTWIYLTRDGDYYPSTGGGNAQTMDVLTSSTFTPGTYTKLKVNAVKRLDGTALAVVDSFTTDISLTITETGSAPTGYTAQVREDGQGTTVDGLEIGARYKVDAILDSGDHQAAHSFVGSDHFTYSSFASNWTTWIYLTKVAASSISGLSATVTVSPKDTVGTRVLAAGEVTPLPTPEVTLSVENGVLYATIAQNTAYAGHSGAVNIGFSDETTRLSGEVASGIPQNKSGYTMTATAVPLSTLATQSYKTRIVGDTNRNLAQIASYYEGEIALHVVAFAFYTGNDNYTNSDEWASDDISITWTAAPVITKVEKSNGIVITMAENMATEQYYSIRATVGTDSWSTTYGTGGATTATNTIIFPSTASGYDSITHVAVATGYASGSGSNIALNLSALSTSKEVGYEQSHEQLDTPTNVIVEQSSQFVYVRWDNVPNATSYTIVATSILGSGTYQFGTGTISNSGSRGGMNVELFMNDVPVDTYKFHVYAQADGYQDSDASDSTIGTVTTVQNGTALSIASAVYDESGLVVTSDSTFAPGGYLVTKSFGDENGYVYLEIVDTPSSTITVVDYNNTNSSTITITGYTISGSSNYTITYTPEQDTPIEVTGASGSTAAPAATNVGWIGEDRTHVLYWDVPTDNTMVESYQIYYSTGSSPEGTWTKSPHNGYWRPASGYMGGGIATVGIAGTDLVSGHIPAGTYYFKVVTVPTTESGLNQSETICSVPLNITREPQAITFDSITYDESTRLLTIVGTFPAGGYGIVIDGYSTVITATEANTMSMTVHEGEEDIIGKEVELAYATGTSTTNPASINVAPVVKSGNVKVTAGTELTTERAPSDIKFALVGGQLELQWTEPTNTTGIARYSIEIKEANGEWTPIASAPAGRTNGSAAQLLELPEAGIYQVRMISMADDWTVLSLPAVCDATYTIDAQTEAIVITGAEFDPDSGQLTITMENANMHQTEATVEYLIIVTEPEMMYMNTDTLAKDDTTIVLGFGSIDASSTVTVQYLISAIDGSGNVTIISSALQSPPTAIVGAD